MIRMNSGKDAARLIDVPLRLRGGRPGPDRRQWVIRPDDLLVLGFDLVNLQIKAAEGEAAAQVIRKGTGQAYLIVWFPPQHIVEKAFFTTVADYPVKIPSNPGQTPPLSDPDQGQLLDDPLDPAPIDAIVSGWSRLAFHVPDGKLPIDWTLEALLVAIRDLELSVPANALPPRAPKPFFHDLLQVTLDQASADKLMLAATAASAVSATAASPLPLLRASLDASAGPPVAGAARVIAVARSRRKLRTLGNALGVTTVTGSASRGVLTQDDLLGMGGLEAIMARPEPAPPGATQTALELPYRIILAPNRFGAWFHAEAPATSKETGHTELWHTRLGVRRQDGTSVDGDDPLRKLRAVWTTDPPGPVSPDATHAIPGHDNFPWRMSLDTFDRHSVVHLSSNFTLDDGKNPKLFYEPDPLDVNLLALTSLGAWLDSRGAWDYPQPYGLSIEEWRHRATLGRDHYVRVIYSGFLFPFGHRASVVKVTERQFQPDLPGNPVYLRQRMFLLVREPIRAFRTSGLRYDGPDANRTDEQYDLSMPFETVRILTLVSPLLDRPEDSDISGATQSCFWPFVGGQPFKFHIVATDTEGNQVDMAMPLIFVGKEETDKPYAASMVHDKVVKEYDTALWPGSSVLRATVPLNGQKMAFADSAGPDDTSFAVKSLTFAGEVPAQAKYDKLGWRQVRFFPVVRKAQIDVPALQKIARTATPVGVVYQGLYLREGFGGSNAGQVFLAVDPDPAAPKLEVKFSAQGDRSGGIITPDMKLSGLSRTIGPVSGNINTAAAGSFSPSAWFGGVTGAKLFGVLALKDILDVAGFNELDKLPQFVGQRLNQVELVISGLQRLQDVVKLAAAPELAAVKIVLDELLAPGTGSIPTLLSTGNIGPVASQLATLKTELDSLANALPGSALEPGPKARLAQQIAALSAAIGEGGGDPELLQKFAVGDLLPQALNARFEWRPVLKPFGPFKPSGTRNLLLSVEAADALGKAKDDQGGKETFTVTCSLDDFVLDLELLILKFERVQIRAAAGRKMDVDVRFTDFEFGGPLSFVQTLREVIPFDGFSDPPAVQVTPAGISAGFSMNLPNLSIGVFSLENLSLGAGFNVPFIGPPMSASFNFCTRENPCRLTVSLFGGGFFFGITMNADGLQILEGAIEFGAACSVDFGVASGSVSAMAGLYFKFEGSDATLAGYFRLRGEVEALGIVSVCIELYLEMRYETASHKCVGTATLSIEVDVALFSVTVEISCTKKFAGSGPDPTLAELMDVQADGTSADWNTYCATFA